MSNKKILTTPEEENPHLKYFLTGNEYVSLANISPNLELKNLTFILQKQNCLLEFVQAKDNLINPLIEQNKTPLNLIYEINYLNYWIVKANAKTENLLIQILIFAPLNFKGFVYNFEVKNLSKKDLKIFCGLKGALSEILQTCFYAQPLYCKIRSFFHPFMKNLIFELRDSTSIAALSLSGDNLNILDTALNKNELKKVYCPEKKFEISSNSTEKINYFLGSEFELPSLQEKNLSFYFGINIEPDGAGGCNVDLQRWGGGKLLQKTSDFLKSKVIKVADQKISALLNRNLFFCYFYSVGKALDTEEIILLTSRSSFYYVSCAFWARDSLLWSFPAILLMDKKFARKVILQAFKIYGKNAGEHALYINGEILYPGFELDELCAFVIALDNYLEFSLDYSILDEEIILKRLKEIAEKLITKLNPILNLFETFLLSSDDPAPYSYNTFMNALAYKTLLILAHFYDHLQEVENKERYFYLAEKVRKAIFEKCTTEVEGNTMFVFCTDGEGNYILGDEPVGSLVLLPYFGFCEKINSIYENTVNWIYSKKNKYFIEGKKITGCGCEHSPYPFVFTLVNNLLSGKNFIWQNDFFKCELDNGFGCETVDKDIGVVKTGRAFATFAGFLVYALYEGYAEERLQD